MRAIKRALDPDGLAEPGGRAPTLRRSVTAFADVVRASEEMFLDALSFGQGGHARGIAARARAGRGAGRRRASLRRPAPGPGRRRLPDGPRHRGSGTAPGAPGPSVSIADVDQAIDEIEAAVGAGCAARRRAVLTSLLHRATEAEARVPAAAAHRRAAPGRARRGDGRRGRQGRRRAGDARPARADALGRPAGDGAVALAGGEAGLRAVGLELFRPILPMLASTAATARPRRWRRSSWPSVEWKLDGIRIQIHRRGDEVRIYTRNLNDITAALPGIVEAIARAAGRAGRARRRGDVDGRRRARRRSRTRCR